MNKMKSLGRLSTWIVTFLIICQFIFPLENASLLFAQTAHIESLDENSRISMDFKGVPLKDVLKVLSQQSGYNFVTSTEVDNQPINLYLDEVTVQDALDTLMDSKDLNYKRKEGTNIYVISKAEFDVLGDEVQTGFATPPEPFLGTSIQTPAPQPPFNDKLVTKVFQLRYKRLSTSAIDIGGQAVAGELSQADTLSNDGDSTRAGGVSNTESTDDVSTGRGIDAIVGNLLSDDGRLSVDLATNSMIVTDYPEVVTHVGAVIKLLDVPSRQVMLEVVILEVKTTLLEDLGVEWGSTNGALGTFTGGSRSVAFPFQESLFNSFDAFTGAKSALTLGTLNAATFTATLHFLLDKSDTKILARPRILTLNNEAAILKLVTDTSVAKVSEQTASEGVSVTTSDTAERTETGISLKMTPQINVNDSIELYLEPSITTVSASTFFSSDFLDPTKRSIRTTVRVNDHETLVIGGIIDTDKSVVVRKIPLLGDIPLIGGAFKYIDGSDADRELLIFITPHIVEDPDAKLVSFESEFIKFERAAPAVLSVENFIDSLDPAEFMFEEQIISDFDDGQGDAQKTLDQMGALLDRYDDDLSSLSKDLDQTQKKMINRSPNKSYLSPYRMD
jgi:type II secretory pathway component GspD/PulD (secretin)